MSPLLLPDPHGHQYYTTFYVLAFLLNQALLLWEGHRRGYPLRPWLLLTTGATLAFIVGTKLIAIPAAEWPALWQHGQWPTDTARSVLGGVLGGTVAGLLLRRWLGFGWQAMDAFVLPMCSAYALQTVGCLLTGCCFGHLAPGGWGVSYAPGTLPYLAQLQRGLIEPGAAHSLPLIPTQALTGLLALGTGGLLWALRRRPWPGGSWRLLQMALLMAGRFGLEFWRDPAGEQVGATLRTIGGITLKQAQWTLLPLTLLTLGWWAWRIRSAAPAPEPRPAQRPLRTLLGVAVLLAATAGLGSGALTLPEMLVVKAGLTVVLALEVAALLRHGAARPRRLGLPLGLASAVLLFTNQAPAPVDSARVQHRLALSPGGMVGAYDEEYVPKGCAGGPPDLYDHRYRVQGADLTYSQQRSKGFSTGYGLGVWAGTERIGLRQLISVPQPYPIAPAVFYRHKQLLDFNPHFDLSWRDRQNCTLMLRTGLHLGTLSNREQPPSITLRNIKPDLLFRVGYQHFCIQTDAGYGLLGVGNYTGRFGMGYQSWDGAHHLLLGLVAARHNDVSHAGTKVRSFVGASLGLGRTGLGLKSYGATDFGRFHQLELRLRYTLPLSRSAESHAERSGRRH
jgi:phosphatidylglycerol:prolipoprotein diacylglycerol transferase